MAEIIIQIRGEDQFSSIAQKIAGNLSGLAGSTDKAAQAAGGGAGAFGKLASGLGNVATVAGGIVAAQIFNKIASGISAFAAQGLDAVSSSQKLDASLNSLFASNLMYERSTSEITTAVSKSAEEMAKEERQLQNLRLERDLQIAKIQEQKERIRQMTDEWTDSGLATQTAQAQLAKMENQLANTTAKISDLETGTVEYATTTKTTFEQVMGLGDAQAMARDETEKLRREIDRIAVISPFEQEQVEQVAKFAVQAGQGADQAAAFTAAFLDLGAAVGIGSQDLGFAADQLLQVQKIGKITTIDLRQLRRLGIDLEKIIGVEMGMSIEEFNTQAGKSPAIFDDLFKSVETFSRNTFAGTAEAFSKSVEGIKSQASDLFRIGARDLFAPLVEFATPIALSVIDKISGVFLGGKMKDIGEGIVKILESAFGMISGDDLAIIDLIEGMTSFGIDRDTVVQIAMIADTVQETIGRIQDAFQEGGLQGVVNEIGSMLSSAWASTVQPALMIWRDNFFGWVTELYPQIPEMLTGLVSSIASWLGQNWPQIAESLMTWTENFWGWAEEAASGAAGALVALSAAMIAWVTGGEGQAALTSLGQQIGQMIVDLTKLAIEDTEGGATILTTLAIGILGAVEAVTATLIIAGGQIVAGIIAGIVKALGGDLEPAMFSELGGILTGIAENGKVIAQQVGKMIVEGIKTGWTNTVQAIEDAFNEGVAAWKSIIVDSDWIEIGGAIISGVLKGIKDNQAKVWELLKDMARKALESATSALGIGSPSKEFIEVGEAITEGLAVGVSRMAPEFYNAINKLLGRPLTGFAGFNDIMGAMADDFEKHAKKTLGNRARGGNVLGAFKTALRANWKSVIDPISGRMMDSAQDVMQNAVRDWGGLIGDSAKDIPNLAAQFVKMFNDAFLKKSILNLEDLIKGAGVAQQFAGFGQEAASYLEAQIGVLKNIVASGDEGLFQGQIIDATTAQEKLNQALEDQAAIQDEIVQLQQAQADLSFLQQQLSLVKMIREAGLDVTSIFGDFTFGLDASITDMVSIMNTAVQSMVSEFNTQAHNLATSPLGLSPGSYGTNADLQTGTGPMGLMVPPGYQNDSFRIGLSSGERILVAPRGRSLEDIMGMGSQGGDTWNITINAGESVGSVSQSLQTLMAFANSGA